MLTIKEYLNNEPASADVTAMATILVPRVNALFTELNIDPSQTSGHRSVGKQVAVYRARAKKAGVPFVLLNVPMGSCHIKGAAVDCADPDGKIDEAVTDALLIKHGLFREAPEDTPGWIHLQCLAPKSGNRTFRA